MTRNYLLSLLRLNAKNHIAYGLIKQTKNI